MRKLGEQRSVPDISESDRRLLREIGRRYDGRIIIGSTFTLFLEPKAFEESWVHDFLNGGIGMGSAIGEKK